MSGTLKRSLVIDDESRRPEIFTVTKNVCKMLIARNISEEEVADYLNETYAEFENRLKKSDSFVEPIDVFNADGSIRYFAVVIPRKKVEKKEIITLVDHFVSQSEDGVVTNIIFVIPGKIDAFRNAVKGMMGSINKKPGVSKFHFFDYESFKFNLPEHVDVPPQRKLSPDEVRHLVEVEGFDPKSFGILPKSDKVARYYGWQEGDIIQITRSSAIDLEKIAYRRVSVPGK